MGVISPLGLSVPAIVAIVPFIGDEAGLGAILDALNRRILPSAAAALPSRLARYPRMRHLAQRRLAILPPGSVRSFSASLDKEEAEIVAAEAFLRDYAERRGVNRVFSIFEAGDLGKLVDAAWLEDVIGQLNPAWLPRTALLVKLLLTEQPDPQIALKLQLDGVLAGFANAAAGDLGQSPLWVVQTLARVLWEDPTSHTLWNSELRALRRAAGEGRIDVLEWLFGVLRRSEPPITDRSGLGHIYREAGSQG